MFSDQFLERKILFNIHQNDYFSPGKIALIKKYYFLSSLQGRNTKNSLYTSFRVMRKTGNNFAQNKCKKDITICNEALSRCLEWRIYIYREDIEPSLKQG